MLDAVSNKLAEKETLIIGIKISTIIGIKTSTTVDTS